MKIDFPWGKRSSEKLNRPEPVICPGLGVAIKYVCVLTCNCHTHFLHPK